MPAEEALAMINFGSRDNARHPMEWDGSENGGFTTGKPWIARRSRSCCAFGCFCRNFKAGLSRTIR